MKFKRQVMSGEDIDRTLIRLSHQIIEKNHGCEDICLVGIKTRGVPLAQRLSQNIENITGQKIDVGVLDISLYRDDLSQLENDPIVNETAVPFSIVDKIVVLVDDVTFTGRTCRAAMDALVDLGRPSKIQFCALIDRGHSELPIKANFVGKNIPTSLDEIVMVNLREVDGVDGVVINEK